MPRATCWAPSRSRAWSPGRVDRTVDVTYIVTEVGDGVTFTSDAVSATSVRMKLGKRYGLLVALLDMAKVAIPVLVLRLVYPGEPYLYLAAEGGIVYEVVVVPAGDVPDGVRWNMTTTVAIKVGG